MNDSIEDRIREAQLIGDISGEISKFENLAIKAKEDDTLKEQALELGHETANKCRQYLSEPSRVGNLDARDLNNIFAAIGSAQTTDSLSVLITGINSAMAIYLYGQQINQRPGTTIANNYPPQLW